MEMATIEQLRQVLSEIHDKPLALVSKGSIADLEGWIKGEQSAGRAMAWPTMAAQYAWTAMSRPHHQPGQCALSEHRHDQGPRILEARQVGATAITTTTKYTPLRPDNAALIMIHHQVGFMLGCQTAGRPAAHQPQRSCHDAAAGEIDPIR